MDQETHDAAEYSALTTVLEAWRDAWNQGTNGKPDGLVFMARLERALSRFDNAALDRVTRIAHPPAKPEAKLEALPTMEDWRSLWRSCGELDLKSDVYDRLSNALYALSKGTVKIVDERGKGAEAERLAPCPVCGKEPRWVDCGVAFGYYVCNQSGSHGVYGTTAEQPQARMAWNAAFERAERFPGER